MADEARTKQQGLQQAASVIFALVAVVPLLIFAWTLNALGVIRSTQAQVSLSLALGVALLGFWMFRSLLSRMAEVVQALTAAVEQATRAQRRSAVAVPPATAVAAPTEPAGSTNGAGAAPAPAVARTEAPVSPAAVFTAPGSAAAPRPALASVAPQSSPRAVAGIGKIRELSEVVRTMDSLWLREATAHLNHRVQITVANSREPLIGTLSEATTDGLILEQPEGPVPIAYGRVTSIDRLSS